MEHDRLIDLYNQLVDLEAAGDEVGARKLVKERFAQLPEDMQGEILARAYFAAAQAQVEDSETLAHVQERALSALDVLEALKEKIEAGEA